MSDTLATELLQAATPPDSQGTLFDLAEVEGFGALSMRERRFCEAITQGLSQRQAARFAGVTGDDAACDVAGSRLARKPEVRRYLDQYWRRAGATIETSIAQAMRMQAHAFARFEEATDRATRADAMRQWQIATTMLATIHGKLSLNVSGTIDHRHAHAHIHGHAPESIPAEALPFLAQVRRSVVAERLAQAAPTDAAA
jgi:hypothetical protein